MLESINEETITNIRNRKFKEYAQIYIDIEHDYCKQVSAYGLPFAQIDDLGSRESLINSLSHKGLHVSNCGKSLHMGWMSRSCVKCRKGVETVTFLISLQCPKKCFFCFNINQNDYDHLITNKNDVVSELYGYYQKGAVFTDIALSGGEPLVHKKDVLDFFNAAKDYYPNAYTRLYTSGAYLTEELLSELKQSGLNEIRFSVKTSDPVEQQKETINKIQMAKDFIPFVMVEMPVMPDEFETMAGLLICLDEIGIDGVNLLELCFPLGNSKEFINRGFSLKKKPFNTLYNYWYAGGLPIAKSEETCLKLLEFALATEISIGIHYCSLENKFTGQVFLQNYPHRDNYPLHIMSERDYFLKIAKVFGQDARAIRSYFDKNGYNDYQINNHYDYLEFPFKYITYLKKYYGDTQIGISYNIVEKDNLKELRIDFSTPNFLNQADEL